MKPKVYVFGVALAAVVALLALVTAVRSPRSADRAAVGKVYSKDRTPTPAGELKAPALPAKAEKALASFRVSTKELPGGATEAVGANYTARVDELGLTFKGGDTRVRLRAASLEGGNATVQVPPTGIPGRKAPGSAQIDRGTLIEEYVFENRRVEQLFHVSAPLSAGEMRVRVDVETSAEGPVRQVPRGGKGWKDSAVWDGGLIFHDRNGQPSWSYHGAVAIDAAGQRCDLEPRYEKGQIVLEVPDTFIAMAKFPLTIDPWLELDFSASGGGLSNNSTVSESPAVALDNSGNPYVAWSDKSSGNFDIYVRFFNGFEWRDLAGSSASGGISKNAGESSHPSMVLNDKGEPLVAWHDDTRGDFEIYFKKFDAVSKSWRELASSASGLGVSKNAGFSLYPSVGLVQAARYDFIVLTSTIVFLEVFEVPIIAWQNDNLGLSEIFVAMYFPGDALAPEGWYGLPNGLTTSTSTGAGISSTPLSVSDRPSLAVDRFGRPFVAWSDTAAGNYEVYLRGIFPSGGGAFLAPGQDKMIFTVLPGAGVNGVTSRIVVDPAGGATTVDITWGEVDGSASAALGDGGVSSQATAGASPGLSLYPKLATDPSTGSLFIAWQESTSATISPTQIFVATCPVLAPSTSMGDATYGTWTDYGNGSLNVGSTGNATNPAIAVSPSDPANSIPARVIVAWQDDESGNPEIYVRQSDDTVAGWTDVGDAGSSFTGGNGAGVSATADLSFTPSIAVNGLQQPVVCWSDGALGAFDLYLRRFFPNEALSLNQADISGPLIVGASTAASTIFLTGRVVTESALSPSGLPGVRMQVEVREVGTPFTGTPTGETSLAVPGLYADPLPIGTLVTYTFNGAPNVRYKWRARSIDYLGRSSSWISFGGNGDDEIDFEVRVIIPVASPLNIDQFPGSDPPPPVGTNVSNTIGVGSIISEGTVFFGASITTPDASTTVQFEVQVAPAADAYGGPTTVTLLSAPQGSGPAAVSFTASSNGSFRWRARVLASSGGSSGFVNFAVNDPATGVDFTIQTPVPTLLDQRTPSSVPIPVGGTIGENNLLFVGTVTSPQAGIQVQLEVELKPTSSGFDGTGLIVSPLVNSGSVVSLPSGTIGQGAYHWRARTRTSTNLTSAFTSFGSNADGQTDFVFGLPNAAPPSNEKDKCGLVGLEALGLLGLLAALRRRRTKA